MCGIAGFYRLNGPADPGLVARMVDSLKHRGPDGSGLISLDGGESSPSVVLGHCRLAIIDLSSAGHQPMSNEDGTVWIVYNGEVYNYVELAEELACHGHRFRSRTDTEVILHAYEEFGVDCLERLNGMFAFALWDGRARRLFCARDRFGIKPFYYHFDGERFLFASEIKALVQPGGVKREPNHQIIYDYLVHGYLDHSEETFFQRIWQLPPSHYLLLKGNDLRVHRWWDIFPDRNGHRALSDEDAAETFRSLLTDAVRLRLRSDVPIGTCLSGGLDSSSIVCLANGLMFPEGKATRPEIVGKRQKTFSSCFEERPWDEREFIREVLEQTGAEANFVFPPGEELFEQIPQVIWSQDEPLWSTSFFAQWHVMRLASQKVKVLLDGQGADELLAGYHRSFGAFYLDLAKRFQIGRLLRELFSYKRVHQSFQPYIFSGLARSLLPKGWVGWLRGQITGDIHWLDPEFQRAYRRDFGFEEKLGTHLDSHLYAILTRYGLPALLHAEDRNSMAFSLESRVPFLDYRLVEFAFTLPASQKIRDGMTKVVLRNAMKGLLPERVRMRTDKMGFVTPDELWFRGEMRSKIEEILTSKRLRERGHLRPERVLEEFRDYCRGERSNSFTLWRWINLELWFRIFIDPGKLSNPPILEKKREMNL